MSWKRKFQGGLLGFIGFLLSPLSWWNDLVINVPLAIGFGWLVSRVYRPAFEPAVVVGYWLTNVIGLILMHKGAQRAVGQGALTAYSRRDILRDLAISVLYTLLIVVLIRLKVLQPFTEYSP